MKYYLIASPILAFFLMMLFVAVFGEVIPPIDKNALSEYIACLFAIIFLILGKKVLDFFR